jgi:hypothetical protein
VDLHLVGLIGEPPPRGLGVRECREVDERREMRPDELARLVAGQRFDRLREVRVATLRVGREDDVRRVLDEEPVALLGLAQLAFEALPIADLAGDALDADEATDGSAWRSSQVRAASSASSAATKSMNGRPIESSGVRPVTTSADSLMYESRPNESTEKMMSGEFSTRNR